MPAIGPWQATSLPERASSPASRLLQGVSQLALTFRPIRPVTISATLSKRTSAMDSPNRMIPAITVPTAPTPVQMA